MAKEGATKKREKTPTAKKRDLQNEKNRIANRDFKSQVRTAVRSFQEAVSKKNNEQVTQMLSTIYSLMDKGVKQGIYKINKASRTKSRLAAKAVI